MFNIGPVEFIVIVVLALVVFGPEKLPDLMRGAGQAIREFQRASRELTEVFQETQEQFTEVIHDTREEFSQALSLDEPLMTSSSSAGAATGPAATESTATAAQQTEDLVPVESEVAITANAPPPPREMETAAGMLDDVVAIDPEPATVNGIAEHASALPPVAPASPGVSAAVAARRPRRRKAEQPATPVDEGHAPADSTSNGAGGEDPSPDMKPVGPGARRGQRVPEASASTGDAAAPAIGSAAGDTGHPRVPEGAALSAPRSRRRAAAPPEAGA